MMGYDLVTRSDPQLISLTCCFGCVDKEFKTFSAVENHLSRHHPERSDFPLLKIPYDADVSGSTAIGHHVLREMHFLIFEKLKMVSFAGRAVPAFKRVNLRIACPPGAFYHILMSAELQARWTASGNLIVDNATGETLKKLTSRPCLDRQFISYKASIDPSKEIKMRLVAKLANDNDGIGRNEIYWLKVGLIVHSQRQRQPCAANMLRVML